MGNNIVNIIGILVNDNCSEYTCYGKKYYKTTIRIERPSKCIDILPIVVSAELINNIDDYNEKKFTVTGSLRSRNYIVGRKTKVETFIFCNGLKESNLNAKNEIEMIGYICRKPKIRKTPNNQIISDFILAIGRDSGKTDYINCIAWGTAADYVATLVTGDNVKVKGRFQSRNYEKNDSSNIAYEVSIHHISKI